MAYQLRVGDQRFVAFVHPRDVLFGSEGPARGASRAATAATTTSALDLAGVMSAIGAMRAAPRTPIRKGAALFAATDGG